MENTSIRTQISQVRRRVQLGSFDLSQIGTAFFVLAVFLVILYLIQFSTPNLAGTDGYYHIKFADLMTSHGLTPEFPWLPLTILSPSEFYDHHFLLHLAMIPFTGGDLVMGAKWASVLFASLAFLSIWWLLHNQRVPYAALWAFALLAVSEAFLYRMSMPRVQSLSLAFLALGLNFLLVKRYKVLAPLSFLYVWLYDGYILIIIMSGLHVGIVWIIERRFNIRPLVYAVLGVGLGLIINPYFPHNIIFSFRHLLPKVFGPEEVRVGSEWYPYTTTQLLSNSPLALLAFVSGTLAIGLRGKRMDVRTGLAFLLTITFALMLFQSRRFIEYFPAFALIFAAFALSPFFDRNIILASDSIPDKDLPIFKRLKNYPLKLWLPVSSLVLLLVLGVFFSIRGVIEDLEGSKPHQRYAGASSWLVSNTIQGERIFQTDWDDFPRLFFYNTWNTYLVGLDPTYLQIKDNELFELWVDITKGRQEKPAETIVESFAAQYILSDLAHDAFINQAEADPRIREVYRDEEAVIFQIITVD